MAAVLGPLLLAALAARFLIDLEAYKPALIRAVKEATGRELVIEGPMKLDLWPEPRVSARRVHFANSAGAVGAQMLDVRWIGVSPSWLALLSGRVEVGRLTLYRPTIALETDADGIPNWHFEPGAGANQPAGAAASGFHLAIGSLHVVQGTLTYTDPQSGQTLKAEDIDAFASVQSLDGPFAINGRATVNGVPLSIDVDVGATAPAGHPARLMLQVANGRLEFKGTASAIKADAELKGHLGVSSGLLTDFLADIVQATAQKQRRFDGPVVGMFGFDGDIELSPTRLALKDFKLSLGTETASGSFAVAGGPSPSLQAKVVLPKVELGKWIDLVKAQESLLAPRAAKAPAPPAPAAAPVTLSPFPPEMTVSIELDVAEVGYRDAALRAVSAKLESKDGVVTVPHLKAVLPGDLVLDATAVAAPPVAAPPAPAPDKPAAAKPAAAAAPGEPVLAQGTVSLAGPRLRDTLAWLGVDTSHLPEGRLQAIDLKARLSTTAKSVQLGDLAMSLDGQPATGSGSLALGPPLMLGATLQLDRFDLDSYMPVGSAASATAVADAAPSASSPAAAAVGAAIAVAPAPPPPDKATPVFAIKAKVGKLQFHGQTIGAVDSDLAVQGNLLTVNGLKIGDLLGAKAEAKGTVAQFTSAPRFDVTFNANLPDADKVLDYVGLPRFLNGRIGSLAASGQVFGTAEAMAVRNVTVSLLDSTGHASGALALGHDFRFDFSAFDFSTQDASRILAVATGQAQQGIGALAVSGAFKGDGARAAFDGQLTAVGTPMTGRIEATLGKRPAFAVNLRVPGTLDVDHWLGVAAGPAAAAPPPPAAASPAGGVSGQAAAPPIVVEPRATSGKPIDLAALRSFDATLKLETSAVAVAALKVLYADLEAKLQNGVLSLGKLTGQFFGGGVDFNGTIDATQQALAVDLRGSLQGIYLGEMLRGALGTNTYGNEHLKVALDGKLSITGIELRGGGTTPQEIRDSLNGRGHVSGYVYPGVAAGSLGMASFATGLGSLFSTDMGFGSAVLAGFINHQNTFEGEVQLSGSTVTLKDQRVIGNNAAAVVNSVNSLTQETTDTVIALDANGRGGVDYTMTVKGPVASPAIDTRGGK
ncbi:MAG: AsmA family protein [Reyranellaceae bacterium]